jgi:hypothetical protein
MPLITRTEKGSKLTIEEMDGNLTYLDNKVPYKVYTALLTQTGTDAPVATVLENTLGEVVFEYYEGFPGEYGIKLTGGYPVGKTFISGFGSTYGQGAITWMPLVNNISDLPQGFYTFYLYPQDDTIYTYFADVEGNKVEMSYFGIETTIPIEIRIYN